MLFARTKDRNFVRGLRVPLICPGEQNRHAEVTVLRLRYKFVLKHKFACEKFIFHIVGVCH